MMRKGLIEMLTIITSKTAVSFTQEDLDKALESLEPKDVLITSNKEVYKELLELPHRNETNVKMSLYIEKNQLIIVNKDMFLKII